MKVGIPQPLIGYTKAEQVDAAGATIEALLQDLDRQFPGIRFRMVDEQDRLRRHVRIFVNRERARDLNAALSESDEVQILQALSGG